MDAFCCLFLFFFFLSLNHLRPNDLHRGDLHDDDDDDAAPCSLWKCVRAKPAIFYCATGRRIYYNRSRHDHHTQPNPNSTCFLMCVRQQQQQTTTKNLHSNPRKRNFD
uniref:Putative secreted protein n=1 Tax=Anopheles triannulatus TaxID=58253 RepID=A0A2M4B584_9DIPT